jgi:hypothetical protein
MTNQNYTTKDFLPTWFYESDLVITEDQIKSRLAAINHLISDNLKFNVWKDFVFIAFGKAPKDPANTDKLIEYFRKYESAIPIVGNERLIQVLATVSLCVIIDVKFTKTEKSTDENGQEVIEDWEHVVDGSLVASIALGVININFLEQYKRVDRIPLIERARTYLSETIIADRDVDVSGVSADIEDMKEEYEDLDGSEGMDNDAGSRILAALSDCLKSHKVLSEELDIMWWIFGEYSEILETSFEEAGPNKIAMVAPFELSNFTQFECGLKSANQFLIKVALLSGGKLDAEITCVTAVNSLTEEQRRELLDEIVDDIDELTPCLLALKKSLEFESGDNWATPYKKMCGGDIEKKHRLRDLMIQVYNEFVFARFV